MIYWNHIFSHTADFRESSVNCFIFVSLSSFQLKKKQLLLNFGKMVIYVGMLSSKLLMDEMT